MTIARARSLRSKTTVSEKALWEILRRRQQWGLRFRRQHPIGPFVVDFVCLERRLIVEVDGEVHDHPRQIAADIERDAWFKIVRLTASVVLNDPERTRSMISEALGTETVAGVLTPHPRPFPRRGGRENANKSSLLPVSKEQSP